jgi:hypothetical protein
MAIEVNDDTFYFDECKLKWTEDSLLKVLINPDWDIPSESIFPLRMLTEHWEIDTGFPVKDQELNEVFEMATGVSLPTTSTGEFDSPDKPSLKKRVTG